MELSPTTLNTLFDQIGIIDVIDVALITLLIYFGIIFVKQSRSFFIFSTIILISLVTYLSGIFDLKLTRSLLEPFLTFFFLILVIVFQREIRRFFEWLSLPSKRFVTRMKNRSISSLSKNIIETIERLVERGHGALIVFEGRHPIDHSIIGGSKLEGNVSVPILLSIFDPGSPGHDGAVIISNNMITHFGVHLPLADNYSNLDTAGTRHRAAAGLTQETDAIVIVVSEERGSVSVARNGHVRKISKEQFKDVIENFLDVHLRRDTNKISWKDFILRNWIEKLSALILSIILWIIIVI